MNDYWNRQSNKPLFEQLEWDRPERKDQAGRLLILGGSTHSLSAPAQAFMLSQESGIGTAKVVLPHKTKKLLKDVPLETLFLPSTPSGEFAHEGKQELLEYAQWADTVLLCGDVGRNSQTTILMSDLLRSYTGQVLITRDSLDGLSIDAQLLFNRENTTIVATIAQLQKLFKTAGIDSAITFTMDLTKLVETLHDLTLKYSATIVVLHNQQIVAAHKGQVSTTHANTQTEPQSWRLPYSVHAACFQTWYPKEPFKALTHTSYILSGKLK